MVVERQCSNEPDYNGISSHTESRLADGKTLYSLVAARQTPEHPLSGCLVVYTSIVSQDRIGKYPSYSRLL